MTHAPTTSVSNTAVFLLGITARIVQGFAVFAPIAVCFRSSANWGVLSPPAIAAGAVASGMAVGSALDRRLRGPFGTAIVIRCSLLLLAAGLWMLWLQPAAEFAVIIGFVLGMAAGTEWSSLANVTRKSLPNSQRWQGMRCWTVAFYVGVAIAIVTPSILSTAVLVVATFAVGCVALASSVELSVIEEPAPEEHSSETPPEPPAIVQETPASENADECDATECCGGSKSWQPTSFAHGVLLSSVGWIALFGFIRFLAQLTWQMDSLPQTVPLSLGLIVGGLLIFSVAPSTGYAVALLPFFLLSIILTAVPFLVPATDFWMTAILFSAGTAFAAVHCGVKLVIGEQFRDCPSDPRLTRVVAVSLFAVSIIVPCVEIVAHLLPSGIWQAIPPLVVMICGLAALRSLPSPLLSSLGEDNPEAPDLDELEDVMATINN